MFARLPGTREGIMFMHPPSGNVSQQGECEHRSASVRLPGGARRSAPLRVGFIGCGPHAAQYHLPGIVAVPELRLAALCSRNSERLREQARRFGVDACYADFRTMLDACPLDVVGVAGPPGLHAEVARECLVRQIPFMTEKPLSTSAREMRELAVLAAAHGDCGMVGFTSRYAPAQRVARRLSCKPAFGRLAFVATGHLTMAAMLPDWGLEDPLECFVHMHGIHAIDLWRFFGGDPAEVRATLSGYENRGTGPHFSGSVLACVYGGGGPHGVIHMKAGASHNGDVSADIMGEWTRIRVENNQTLTCEHGRDWVQRVMEADVLSDVIPPDAPAGRFLDVTGLAAPAYYPDFFRFEWLALARSLLAGRSLTPSITDACRTGFLADAIVVSLRNDGAPTRIADDLP